MAELKARGVLFEECDVPGVTTVKWRFHCGGVKTARFKDTENNIFAIVQLATAPSVR